MLHVFSSKMAVNICSSKLHIHNWNETERIATAERGRYISIKSQHKLFTYIPCNLCILPGWQSTAAFSLWPILLLAASHYTPQLWILPNPKSKDCGPGGGWRRFMRVCHPFSLLWAKPRNASKQSSNINSAFGRGSTTKKSNIKVCVRWGNVRRGVGEDYCTFCFCPAWLQRQSSARPELYGLLIAVSKSHFQPRAHQPTTHIPTSSPLRIHPPQPPRNGHFIKLKPYLIFPTWIILIISEQFSPTYGSFFGLLPSSDDDHDKDFANERCS